MVVFYLVNLSIRTILHLIPPLTIQRLSLVFFLFRNTSLYYALPLNVEYSHVRMDLLGTDHLSVRFDFNGFCDTKHQFVMTAGTMSSGS